MKIVMRFVFLFLILIPFTGNAEKWAVLVSNGDYLYPFQYEPSITRGYWSNLALIYKLLRLKLNYDAEHILVFYGRGEDPPPNNYLVYPSWYVPENVYNGETKIVYFPAYISTLNNQLNILTNKMGADDQVLFWWFGHGGNINYNASSHDIKNNNGTQEIIDYSVSSNEIQNMAEVLNGKKAHQTFEWVPPRDCGWGTK